MQGANPVGAEPVPEPPFKKYTVRSDRIRNPDYMYLKYIFDNININL